MSTSSEFKQLMSSQAQALLSELKKHQGDDSLFKQATSASDDEDEWRQNLTPQGSCDELLTRLKNTDSLLIKTGDAGITALDKAVEDGNAILVKHIVEMFDENGKFNFTEGNITRELRLEELLSRPINNTGIKSVTMAALFGNQEIVKSLSEAIKKCKDLHLAKKEVGIVIAKNTEVYRGIYTGSSVPDDPQHKEKQTGEEGKGKCPCSQADVSSSSQGSENKNSPSGIPPAPTEESLSKFNADFAPNSKSELALDIQMLKKFYKKDEDFKVQKNIKNKEMLFFFHFLCRSECSDKLGEICEVFIKEADHQDPSLLCTLFLLQDSKGRTPLHVVLERSSKDLCDILTTILKAIPEEGKECVNARDGAGRTPLHRACIANQVEAVKLLACDTRTDLNARVCAANYESDLVTLLNWKSPHTYSEKYERMEHCTALHLAVLHNNIKVVHALLETLHDTNVRGKKLCVNAYLTREDRDWGDSNDGFKGTPLQLAARMGHPKIPGLPTILGLLLKEDEVLDPGKSKNKKCNIDFDPALHIAAFAGRAEAVQEILNDNNYNPLVKNMQKQTALHRAVEVRPLVHDMLITEDLLPYGKLEALQNSLIRNDLEKPRNYNGNEVACISLLLQAGIDIWSLDNFGRQPYPGQYATDEAVKLWYDKVKDEVANVKDNLSSASNAASFVAALVATAAFIGPLEPPLGYDSVDGYIHISQLPIRVYLVCNGLSFYLAMAAILLAVIPALLPKRKLAHDFTIGRLCLKTAGILIMIALASLLTSYAAASAAVVPKGFTNASLVYITMIIGGGTCLFIYLFSIFLVYFTMDIFTPI